MISIARSGKKGRFTLRVTCAARCKLSGRVSVTRKVARTLGRKRLTLLTVKRTITSTRRRTIRVKLPKGALTLKAVVVKARFTATYADGRKRTATRTLRIRR